MEIVNSINDALWSYVITIVLVGAAIYFTVRSRGVQFRFLKDALRIMAGRDRNTHKSALAHPKKIGSFKAFVESTLAQLYKKRGTDSFYGGPAYYMETGLGKRWMGILFSIFMILSFSLAQSMLQAQTIITSLHDSIPVSPLFLAISLGLLLALIVFGGVHRISNVVSYMVPFMALGYIILALHK